MNFTTNSGRTNTSGIYAQLQTPTMASQVAARPKKCVLYKGRHKLSVKIYARVASAPGGAALYAMQFRNRSPTPVLPVSTVSKEQEFVNIADLDAQNFTLNPSVDYWRTFSNHFNPLFSDIQDLGDTHGASDNERPIDLTASIQRLNRMVADSGATADIQAATYWAYHGARMSFFIVQAMAGLATHTLHEALEGLQGDLPASSAAGASVTPLGRLQKGGQRELVGRATEAVGTWQQDYRNIAAGRYRLPWDMVEVRHPQNNPLELLRRSFEFAGVASDTLRRRVRGEAERLWMSSAMYPGYFNKSFHYQTDGWLSNESAEVYEHSTEVLFFGRQDAMQRTALVPIQEYVAQHAAASDGTGLKLLELACGTGRFHTYLKDNFLGMSTIMSDLSPFYLQAARHNMKRWRDLRVPADKQLGGADNTGTEFLQMSAEKLQGIADSSLDIVVVIYLYHELPDEARHNAAAEMFRVLRPGGIVVLTDSVQRGDRLDFDGRLTTFEAFNEPYYR